MSLDEAIREGLDEHAKRVSDALRADGYFAEAIFYPADRTQKPRIKLSRIKDKKNGD